MSQRPRRPIARAITSSAFDLKIARLACWFVSGLVLVLGLLKLCQLPLNEVELFLGVLLVSNLSMVCVLIGLVLPLVVKTDENETP